MQNGYIESFNGRMQDEMINETLFRDLTHARQAIENLAADYNTARPHSALGYKTPQTYTAQLAATGLRASHNESSARRKGYVSSAYGADILFGRRLNYAATDHGGNRLLRERDPRNFPFTIRTFRSTILQRLSPDLKTRIEPKTMDLYTIPSSYLTWVCRT